MMTSDGFLDDKTPPWVEAPTYDCHYYLPPEERYLDAPDDIVDRGRLLLRALLKEIPSAARLIADAVRLRTGGRFHGDMLAVARLVGADWRDIMLANIAYDLRATVYGCSVVALATPTGPVVARNMDWWPEEVLARGSCLVRFYGRDDRLCVANAGWPGTLGVVTGLSGRGFAAVVNAVKCPERSNKLGYPVLLHLRRVLEDAPDFAAALKMLSDTKLAVPAIITLVGSENDQRVVIERSPTRHALRWPKGDGPLVATNDYRLLFQPTTSDESEIYRTTCARYTYLLRYFADYDGRTEVTDTDLLWALTDPNVLQHSTAQQILMRPRTNDIKLYVPRRLVETPPRERPARTRQVLAEV